MVKYVYGDFMKRKWSRVRHRIIIGTAKIILWPFLKLKYHFSYKKFQKDKRGYLVLANHQTAFDQFFIAYLFNLKTYYVASDDLLNNRFISRLLQWAVRIIPYKKASTDFTILRTCKKVSEEGCNIVMFPEGNRTFSGQPCQINPTVAKMAKFLKMPVAIVNIEGGFGVLPRFSNKGRKGKCSARVTKIIEYDEYKDLEYDEIYKMIKKELYVDESLPSGPFKSKKKANYLERVIYHCPHCGFSHFYSNKNKLSCSKCNLEVRYNDFKQFESNDKTFKFKNVAEWYNFQRTYLSSYPLTEINKDEVIFEDRGTLNEIIPRKKRKTIVKDGLIKLYSNRIEFKNNKNKLTLFFEDITSSGIFGKNKINFYTKEKTYQIKSDVHFNAIKYGDMIYRYKQIKKEVDSNVWCL